MKFSVTMPGLWCPPGFPWIENLTPDEMAHIAKSAEDLGFDSLRLLSDHMGVKLDVMDRLGPRWIHTASAVSYFAAVTERIELTPLIIVPYRHPLDLARVIATLDFFSRGRLTVVAAVGYMEWEFDALGVKPFEERGDIMDEYLAAMIELWTQDRPQFHGRYVDFDDIVLEPKPIRKPYPRLWLGGRSSATIRRAVRFGDGWTADTMPYDAFVKRLADLRTELETTSRDRPFDVFLSLFDRDQDPKTHALRSISRVVVEKEEVLERIAEYAELGVTETEADSVIGGGSGPSASQGSKPVRSVTDFIERMQWFAEEIFPEARKMVPRSLS